MPSRDRPNILCISNHDSSAWNYGCYGDQYGHTPRIDQFAAEGVRYTRAFTAGPICSPSRTNRQRMGSPSRGGTNPLGKRSTGVRRLRNCAKKSGSTAGALRFGRAL
ncbi:MAG: hypothetical protein CME28_04530 [Gemmatimonadetes bacterium]|nr:hypothetical protein [Gemmatimonadota bacterium]